MKKLVFSLMALVSFAFNGYAQMEDQKKIKEEFSKSLNDIRLKYKESNGKMNEEEAKELIENNLALAREYMLSSFKIDNEILLEEFGDINSPQVFTTAAFLFNFEDFSYETNSSTWDLVTSCLVDSAGIAGVAALLQQGIKAAIKEIGIRGIIKTVGKFLSKYLGWIGAAVAVYDFAECMYTGD